MSAADDAGGDRQNALRQPCGRSRAVIIDAHVHVMPPRVVADPGLIAAAEPWFAACHARGERVVDADQLVRSLDEGGVAMAICFTWPFADPALCAEANDYLAAAQRRHPRRLIGFGVVQPARPGAADEVRRCARLGLRGIGEMNADAQGWDLLEEGVRPAVAASVEVGLPWTLHCSEPLGRAHPGRGTTTPDRVMAFAERHADLSLVCAHLGGGLPLYAHIPRVREVCSRLFFDTSAQPFVYEPTIYRALLDGVGAERILLGSDHPLLEVSRYLAALAAAAVPVPAQERICWQNARDLLQLDCSP